MKRIIALLLFCSSAAFGSGKDYVPGFLLVNAISMASNITSGSVDVRGWDNIDLELIASGSGIGNFFVDCSLNQLKPPSIIDQVWVTIPLSPAPVSAGVSTNIMIELNQMGCMYIRLRYAATSGTGTLTAYVGQKQI